MKNTSLNLLCIFSGYAILAACLIDNPILSPIAQTTSFSLIFLGGIGLIIFGVRGLKKTKSKILLAFSGRMNRKEFFLAQLISVPVLSLFSVYLMDALSILRPHISGPQQDYVVSLLYYLPFTLFVIYLTSFAVRRLHDLNRAGSWVFWGFVPIINIGISFWLLFVPGDDVNNPYGPSIKNRRLSFKGIFFNKWDESVSVQTESSKNLVTISSQAAPPLREGSRNQAVMILSIIAGGILVAAALYWVRTPSAEECFTREMYKWGTERELMDQMYDLAGPDADMSVAKAKTFLRNYDRDSLNNTDKKVYDAVTTMFEYCGVK